MKRITSFLFCRIFWALHHTTKQQHNPAVKNALQMLYERTDFKMTDNNFVQK
ncbi:MAG: hypothetical protein LBS09_08395 [Bacteroidales bacterium]|nr:hypothetical protein [Bacteroidales bacterium]